MTRVAVAIAVALLLSSCVVLPVLGVLKAEADKQATEQELQAATETWQEAWLQTNDVFEARRQVILKHLPLRPTVANKIDELTEIAWVAQGGDWADAECHIRGFQFGTAHHQQCAYEVKMEGWPPHRLQSSTSRASGQQPSEVVGQVEQGEKVYDPGECIGPVIMGKCEGTVLPKTAYHPTCYGTWLNGHCTGPMF